MQQGKPTTLTDWVRLYTGGFTSRLGHWLVQFGIHPDTITVAGLAVVAIAAYVASQGHFFWSGVIMLAGMPLDALDGAVARAMQRKDKFGAFLDSTLDRYADGFIFMALAYYFSEQGDSTTMLVSMATLLGSILVSYTRARAEGLGLDCKVGLFTRMERVLIILVMMLAGQVKPGLWVLAVGTHLTVLQRGWHIYRLIKQQGGRST